MQDSTRSRQVIAVCGKGGVGKTAFSAMLTRALIDRGESAEIARTSRLLVIDADPALGLAIALGLDVPRTIADVREEIIATARSRDADLQAELAAMLDYLVFESLVETDTYAFLAMGRTEAAGCYCSVNNLLKDAIQLLSAEFDTILIDGEAGLEQINRQVMGDIDELVLLTDGSARGLHTVRQLIELAGNGDAAHVGNIGVVLNRPMVETAALETAIASLGTRLLGVVPADPEVAAYDACGRSLMGLPDSSPAAVATARIAEALGSKHG